MAYLGAYDLFSSAVRFRQGASLLLCSVLPPGICRISPLPHIVSSKSFCASPKSPIVFWQCPKYYDSPDRVLRRAFGTQLLARLPPILANVSYQNKSRDGVRPNSGALYTDSPKAAFEEPSENQEQSLSKASTRGRPEGDSKHFVIICRDGAHDSSWYFMIIYDVVNFHDVKVSHLQFVAFCRKRSWHLFPRSLFRSSFLFWK